MQTWDGVHGFGRYPWTVDAQFDLETDLFHNLYEFLYHQMSNSFPEFQFKQSQLKFHPNLSSLLMGLLMKSHK